MSFIDSYGAMGASFVNLPGGAPAINRMYVWSGGGSTVSVPAVGADVDGVVCVAENTDPVSGAVFAAAGYAALPGLPVRVEVGAAVAAGALLQADSLGRAITRTTGIAVLKALTAGAGTGSVVWAVWTSGR
jgi:hypothetical protein